MTATYTWSVVQMGALGEDQVASYEESVAAQVAAAVRAVKAGEAQRICTPGQWRVRRKNGSVMVEIFERPKP